MFAGQVRRQSVSHRRGFRHWRWRLDEMYVKLNGEMVYLSRAVDQVGEILESYVTKSRDKDAALTFMKKALKRHGSRRSSSPMACAPMALPWPNWVTPRNERSDAGPTNEWRAVTFRFDEENAPRCVSGI